MTKNRNPKITLVGAGGLSFGPTMVNDVIATPALAGATLMLHDIDPGRLEMARKLADRLNAAKGSPITVESSLDPATAMTGADFTLVSAEVNRWDYWKQDFEVPRRFGARQLTGENGGPGAVFHSLRSIRTTLGICRDLERYCPETFLINLSNPMSRVTLAIARHTKLRHVGMCHEFDGGLTRMALMLRLPKSRLVATAAGINHFTFFTKVYDSETGEDYYSHLREFWRRPYFQFDERTTRRARALARIPLVDMAVDQAYTPLVAFMFERYGRLACCVDSHIGEYVPFATDVVRWHPTPVYLHEGFARRVESLIRSYGNGKSRIPLHRMGHSPEEPVPIIAAMWTGEARLINAVNVANRGYIPNLPDGAIVEVPAIADGDGLHPLVVHGLTTDLTDLMRVQISLQDMVVRAAVTGDADLAFEALCADPLSPPDREACRAMFDELHRLQAPALGLAPA